MEINSPKLFIEINNSEYIFFVGDKNEEDNFKLIYECIVPVQGIDNSRIVDLESVFKIIKKNIYLLEQKLSFTFKETVLILNNFNCSFLNVTGFKKLNGSQILKENITYILNSLKSNINKIENNKKILHIFNSKYYLDKKEIKNLPIGLFGDFYSHELSLSLINNNDYKNLNNIFKKCNLNIKKIFLKSFTEGSYLSIRNSNLDTFFFVKLNEKNSQIFYFENNALKFEQSFSFGSDLVLSDICKITSLKKDTIKIILKESHLSENISSDELVEKKFFKNDYYKKIKKKLILEIAIARISEFSQILLNNNVNFSSFKKKNSVIFLKLSDMPNFQCLKKKCSLIFSNNNYSKVRFIDKISTEDLIINTNQLVEFGWKKEAIPISHSKKSIIARFFDLIFG